MDREFWLNRFHLIIKWVEAYGGTWTLTENGKFEFRNVNAPLSEYEMVAKMCHFDNATFTPVYRTGDNNETKLA